MCLGTGYHEGLGIDSEGLTQNKENYSKLREEVRSEAAYAANLIRRNPAK